MGKSKVYVGSLACCVTQVQLHALFSQFGLLDKVLLQTDPFTEISRGFAFLTYKDPKDANLAIQTMSGQILAGRPLKTGWASHQASAEGVIKSDEFPEDANLKIQNANAALRQLTGASFVTTTSQVDRLAQHSFLAVGSAGALGIMPSTQLASVADAEVAPNTDAAMTGAKPAIADAAIIIGSESKHILVHNMFDKEEETEHDWKDNIKLDFEEECAQHGTISQVLVMSNDTGGKLYASYDTVESAMRCAKNLAGRWFDKRQLRVEFVNSLPDSA